MKEQSNLRFMKKNIKESDALPEGLNLIVMRGFGKCGEVVFAKGLANPSTESISVLLKVASDLTGVECNINKIHIDDFVREDIVQNHQRIISDGLAFVKHMALIICRQFPQEQFRFILSEDEGEFPSVVFRFHKKRLEESWLMDDIEKYDSGVYILDTE